MSFQVQIKFEVTLFQLNAGKVRIVDIVVNFNVTSSFQPFQGVFQGLGGVMQHIFIFPVKQSVFEKKKNKISLNERIIEMMISPVPEEKLTT